MVLLVEDYVDTRQMYAEYLEFSGCETVQAGNGVEALERALDRRPDVILMDLSLPVVDGWEATRRLKADPRTAMIPVLALTGHAFDGSFEAAKGAGCDGFITKPCLPEHLLTEVWRLLPGRNPPSGPRKLKLTRGRKRTRGHA